MNRAYNTYNIKGTLIVFDFELKEQERDILDKIYNIGCLRNYKVISDTRKIQSFITFIHEYFDYRTIARYTNYGYVYKSMQSNHAKRIYITHKDRYSYIPAYPSYKMQHIHYYAEWPKSYVLKTGMIW